MTGRVVIVTGASSGLGYETARYLCEGGNDVILACRDEEKAQRAIAKLKLQNPTALATYMHLDLASLKSVRQFVEEFKATGKKLNVLINNAGVALNFKDSKRQYTEDNFELTIGTNHLGPFLLTNLLLDALQKSATEGGDARIVIITSSMHEPKSSKRAKNLQPLDVDNLLLFNEGTYTGLQAYKNSKAANLLFNYQLAKKLDGTGVKVNAVCPGIIPTTDLMRHAGGAQKAFARYVLHGMLRFAKLTRTVPQAAAAICALATDDKFKDTSGKFFKDGVEVKSSDETLDEDLQARLWELSGRYTRLDGYEPLEVVLPAAPTPAAPPAEQEKQGGEPNEESNKEAEEETTKKGEEKNDDTTKDADTKNENKNEEKGEDKEKNDEEKKDEEKVGEELEKGEKIEEAATNDSVKVVD